MRDGLSSALIMPLALVPALFMTVASCATNAEPAPPVHGGEGAICTGDGLGQFVGKTATQELGARILETSGAQKLRWVAHGMMVTMDYRADRVTVYLDPDNKVERLSCG